jgi:hypothetical protein
MEGWDLFVSEVVTEGSFLQSARVQRTLGLKQSGQTNGQGYRYISPLFGQNEGNKWDLRAPRETCNANSLRCRDKHSKLTAVELPAVPDAEKK